MQVLERFFAIYTKAGFEVDSVHPDPEPDWCWTWSKRLWMPKSITGTQLNMFQKRITIALFKRVLELQPIDFIINPS